jgi:hypothetical protein
MNTQVGIIPTEIKLVKVNPELVKDLISKRDVQPFQADTIEKMLRHNVWTVKQFADLTGLAISTITNLTRPNYDRTGRLTTGLNFCYPFPDLEGTGPKYIIRDEKSEKYL